MAYDPNATYEFTDPNTGEKFTSKGDNGYVWQAMTSGLPLSRNSEGEWFVTPYIDRGSDGKITAYIPDWFKQTAAYNEWENLEKTITSSKAASMTIDELSSLNDYLKGLGSMGAVQHYSLNTAKDTYGLDDVYSAKYVNNILNAYTELNGGAKAQISLGDKTWNSLEDFANDYKNMNKEDLSAEITSALNLLSKAASNQETYGNYFPRTNLVQKQQENPQPIQQRVSDALTKYELLGAIADNSTWHDGEYQGILEASGHQKWMTGLASYASAGAQNPLANLILSGINLAAGIKETPQEYLQNFISTSSASGAGLNGRENAISVGGIAGTVANITLTVAEIMLIGDAAGALGTKLLGSSSKMAQTAGALLSKTGTFATNPAGVFTADLLINDIPMDLAFFFTKATQTGDWKGALLSTWSEQNKPVWTGTYDKNGNKVMTEPYEDKQKLVPIMVYPVTDEQGVTSLQAGIGPEVPSGLITDLAGDVIADITVPFANMLFNVTTNGLDSITHGTITRMKTDIAIKNFELQKKLTDIPVLGTSWKKMTDAVMGPQKANLVRQAKQDAINTHSLDPYIRIHNALTLMNHGGSEAVSRAFKMLDESWGVSKAAADFIKNKNNYGGVGKVETKWEKNEAGNKSIKTRMIDDVLPRDVKQGVLDIERLAELKGQQENLGGVVDTKAEKEIAKLEQRVAKLPQDIKDFADKLSGLNKDVERIGIAFGITNKDWFDHLITDPQFEKYMTRQALVPYTKTSETVDGTKISAQWTKSRTGRYAADKYVDPIIALHMKVAALGRTVADNEIAKSLVGFQKSQGTIVQGGRGLNLAERISEANNRIKTAENYKKSINYDGTKGDFAKNMQGVKESVVGVWDAMVKPEEISLKSVYQSMRDPQIAEHVQKFDNGKIRFSDDAIEKSGLSDVEASTMVSNTYRMGEHRNTPDNTKEIESSSNVDYAGITSDGVPYSYKVENGEITSITKINDPEGLADSIRSFGYTMSAEDAARFGQENCYALNRAAMFYRDSVPTLPFTSGFQLRRARKRNTMGWIENAASSSYNYRMEGGKVIADFTTNCAENYYLKERGGKLDEALKESERKHYHPKNSTDRANVPVHEMGHSYMQRLIVLDINRRIENGELAAVAKSWEGMSGSQQTRAIANFVGREWVSFQEKLAKNALDRLGIEYNGNNWKQKWREQADTISQYAADPTDTRYKWETFSEAFTDYWANGQNASPFTLAIMQEVFGEADKYAQAADPKQIMKANGLETKGLFKDDGSYDFGNAKTNKQKAKWLDEKRQANPYLKDGLFSPEEYQKANLWDTYFRKEALAYDRNSKTTTPNKLVDANAKFQDYMADNGAKMIMNEIKKHSVDGFSDELATIMLSKNRNDVSDAIETYITGRVNASAEAIAKNMIGDFDDNLNKARITLFSDEDIINSTVDMMRGLIPDATGEQVEGIVRNLFDEQAKGYASVDKLPVETKNLLAEVKELKKELRKENKKTVRIGNKMDADLLGDDTHIIRYREDGEDVYVVVNDPVIASILKRPGNFKEAGVAAEAFAHMGNFISRTYRLGTTGINPVAFVRNVIRDPVQAMFTAGFNPLDINLSPIAFYKTLRQYGLDDTTIKQVELRLRDWASGQTLTKQIRDDHISGSTLTGVGYRNSFEKNVKKLDKLTENKVVNFLEKPLDTWESALRTQIAQQSFAKTFKKTGNVETSMARAMFDASNATTNFSHSINRFQRAASTVPYLTSAINGTASFWRLFNIDPVGMTTRITAGFVVPVMAITAWNLSSDERRETYMGLPDWWRDGHLILMDEDGNKIFAFTIPEELKAFYGTTRRLVEYTQDVSPSSIPTILAQGALGLLPGDTDGFVNDYGEWDLGRGMTQYFSGLVPQAVNLAYELWAEENLYTGEDLSRYTMWDKVVNGLSNMFGTEIKQAINDIGYMCGASEKEILGKGTADTLARDLFGQGFNSATSQFMSLIGRRAETTPEGKEIKATGLFAERDELMRRLDSLTRDEAFASDEDKQKLEDQKQELIDNFTKRVTTLTNKYMQLYSLTGGLKDWQKKKIVSILNLATNDSSAPEGSYQRASGDAADLDEYSVAVQRYVDAGLPAGATLESLARNEKGNMENSLEVRAALNRYYGVSKQATTDLSSAIENSGLKDVKDRFYEVMQRIYDSADEQGLKPDYDIIERIQARYLQMVDAAIIPLVNQYGINILSNNDFINEVRNVVNGMIPSDDWKQSVRNAKKYLSAKDYPTATVDVKKWLQNRYASGMRDRGLSSDQEVIDRINSIQADIDAGRYGAAKGKIEDLKNGINKASYYISSKDFQTLNKLYNMVK